MEDASDWATVTISVAALLYTAYEARLARRHDRMLSSPRLAVDCTNIRSAPATIRLFNAGLGPAVIRDYRLKIDGRSLKEAKLETRQAITAALNLWAGVTYTRPRDQSVLASNASYDLISVPVDTATWSKQTSETISAAFARISFEIEYEGLDGQRCQPFRFDGATDNKAALAIGPLDDELRD